jgi:hypothetical protein
VSTSLDLLEHEDRLLVDQFRKLDRSGGSGVEARYDYGNAAKLIFRHGTIREACLVDVVRVLALDEELVGLGDRWLSEIGERRRLLNTVGDASRSIQGISLRLGQAFGQELGELVHFLTCEIDVDLGSTLPAIRQRLVPASAQRLHDAGFVHRHAPTRLDPDGPSWVERWSPASRVATIWGHLRDHPRASREARMM